MQHNSFSMYASYIMVLCIELLKLDHISFNILLYVLFMVLMWFFSLHLVSLLQ